MIQKNLIIPSWWSKSNFKWKYRLIHDPKEFNDPQVLNDPKGISIGNMDFDNPKVYGDTSIFDGLVFTFSQKTETPPPSLFFDHISFFSDKDFLGWARPPLPLNEKNGQNN